MLYFFIFAATLVFSFFLTGYFTRLGRQRGVVTKPRARDIHKKPIPRIGGLAISISFLIVSLIVFLVIKSDFKLSDGLWFGVDKQLLAIWAGAIIISASMLIDDVKGLKSWQKFIFQITAALIVIASGIGIDTLANPFGERFDLNAIYIPIVTINGITYHFSLISDIFTLIWLVGMMNVINFIDGVDGLASGISTIAAGTIFLLSLHLSVNQPEVALISLILAASSIGFLVWNFPPAKTFMGDNGSMFLGLILGVLPLLSGGKLATAFLVLGYPIIDGLIVAGGRVLKGKNPFNTPDKTHLHHRFIDAGYSARQAILVMYAISAAFAWVALRSSTIEKLIAFGALLVVIFFLIMFLRHRRKRLGSSV